MFEFHEGTYEELYHALGLMGEEARKKKIQVLPSSVDGDVPTGTMPVYAIGTVQELCDPNVGIRSCYDNENHLDDVVLISDHFPFADDGAIAHDLMTAEPIYGSNQRRFTIDELNYLLSLGFNVKDDDDTLVFTGALFNLSVKIEDNEVVLTVYHLEGPKTFRFNIFYEFIYVLLSYMRD